MIFVVWEIWLKNQRCFKNPNKPSCIDLFLTNCSEQSQDTQVMEKGLSDFNKMNIVVLNLQYTKQNHRNYEKFDSKKFGTKLKYELMKFYINNIEFQTVRNIL